MAFVPWMSFARIVQRYAGDAGVRSLTCAEQFRVVLELDAPPAVERMHRVRAAVDAAPQSLWDRWSGAAVATLVRESGF